MSRKHFSWLLFITFLVAALVMLVPGKTGKESSIEQTALLPGAAGKINDIDWLRVSSAGNVTVATLQRRDQAWVVEEASDYRADWDRLKSLLYGLAQAKVIEAKTSNPDYYARLGVEDIESPEATGVLLEFSADSGLPAVIIGGRAQGRDGQYARLRDAGQSVLINTSLTIPGTLSAWLETAVVDISDAEVVGFEVAHPDGETIKASKASADDENFLLQDIPQGQEPRSAWSVNSLAGALSGLRFESVVPDEGFDWENASRFSLLTADGLLLEAQLTAQGEETYWLRLEAGLYTTALDAGVAAEATDAVSTTAQRAEEINNRVAGWAYQIPGYKFDTMVKRMADLLQPIEES